MKLNIKLWIFWKISNDGSKLVAHVFFGRFKMKVPSKLPKCGMVMNRV
jgi:hypothetical protein